MIEIIKKLFTASPPVPPRMAGASFLIYGPLPSLGICYNLERHVNRLGLCGWMRMVQYVNIEMEVYGNFQTITELKQQMDRGLLLPLRQRYDMTWLPHMATYSTFTFNVLDTYGSRL